MRCYLTCRQPEAGLAADGTFGGERGVHVHRFHGHNRCAGRHHNWNQCIGQVQNDSGNCEPRNEANPTSKAGAHIPIDSPRGGVLTRPGHTEAAMDLARLAGCSPAGVLCEVVDKVTGEMARTEQLLAMAKQHSIKCITIEDLIRFRLEKEAGS